MSFGGFGGLFALCACSMRLTVGKQLTRGAEKARSSGLPCNCRSNEEFHLISFVTAIKQQGLAGNRILNNCRDGRAHYKNKQKAEPGRHMYSLGR